MTYFPENMDRIVDSCTQLTKLTIRSNKNDASAHMSSLQKLTFLRELKLVVAHKIPPVAFNGLVQFVHLTELTLIGAIFSTNVARGDLNVLTNLRALKLTSVSVDNFDRSVNKLTKLERLVIHHRTNLKAPIFIECSVLPNLTSLEVDSLTTKGNYCRLEELTKLKKLQLYVSHCYASNTITPYIYISYR